MAKKKNNDGIYGWCAFIVLFIIMNFIDIGFGIVWANTQPFIWLLIMPCTIFNLFLGIYFLFMFSSWAQKYRVKKSCNNMVWVGVSHFFVIYGVALLLGAAVWSGLLNVSLLKTLNFVFGQVIVASVIYMLLICYAFRAVSAKKLEKGNG